MWRACNWAEHNGASLKSALVCRVRSGEHDGGHAAGLQWFEAPPRAAGRQWFEAPPHTVRDMKGRNGRFTLLLHAMHAQHQKATPRAL
jgi:hypothetical protein